MLQHYSRETVDPRGMSTDDIELGKRIRFYRQTRGLSQERLGNKLGITFQQVQKYENGVNRISATRLATIARILAVPMSDLLPDDPGTQPMPIPSLSLHAAEIGQIYDSLTSSQKSALMRIARTLANPQQDYPDTFRCPNTLELKLGDDVA